MTEPQITLRELLEARLMGIDHKLEAVLKQVTITNSRVDHVEDDVIRLQAEHKAVANPWAAGSVASGIGVALYAIWEKFSK